MKYNHRMDNGYTEAKKRAKILVGVILACLTIVLARMKKTQLMSRGGIIYCDIDIS